MARPMPVLPEVISRMVVCRAHVVQHGTAQHSTHYDTDQLEGVPGQTLSTVAATVTCNLVCLCCSRAL